MFWGSSKSNVNGIFMIITAWMPPKKLIFPELVNEFGFGIKGCDPFGFGSKTIHCSDRYAVPL